ncbi:hypothetical protein OE88DRAFT_1662564 [Heliocybe sulcata]|uniref:Uncharacterized protein n=1 Tax=Heliocybe sulcata TaxID=5364 RepID=A0A5C3MY97_9AGAM|nr:hypothetical protein OE88DRAFT_1662564 [Heliocybe sulcata]
MKISWRGCLLDCMNVLKEDVLQLRTILGEENVAWDGHGEVEAGGGGSEPLNDKSEYGEGRCEDGNGYLMEDTHTEAEGARRRAALGDGSMHTEVEDVRRGEAWDGGAREGAGGNSLGDYEAVGEDGSSEYEGDMDEPMLWDDEDQGYLADTEEDFDPGY